MYALKFSVPETRLGGAHARSIDRQLPNIPVAGEVGVLGLEYRRHRRLWLIVQSLRAISNRVYHMNTCAICLFRSQYKVSRELKSA